MKNARLLTITRGEEFKLSLKEEIQENDIFYEQYMNAAGMLDDIVAVNEDEKKAEWRKVETENNIIAFCGERGVGKSSAMMTFINSLSKKNDWNMNPIFADCENVKGTIFSKPIIIDPSTFDDVHNILEVIVASLYREFHAKYKANPEGFDAYKREELLEMFQKVYRIISLLNNPRKMLEEEFDGESNIENLSRMGESTALKRELKLLIKIYLEFMVSGNGKKKLLIAIDDLDLCNANAYKMAEQIRKYLIIPDVVIIMALKIEQLQMCVQEEKFKNYSNILRGGEKPSEFYEEVRNMAEKYITKLIPRSRRIHLPDARYLMNTHIQYQNRNGSLIYENHIYNSLSASLLDMIYAKTGMRFLLKQNGTSWLQADNLRDMVNMIALLGNMPDPIDDQGYYDNIEIFAEYIEKEWIPQNYEAVEVQELQSLLKMPYFQMNSETIYLLQNRYVNTKQKHLLPATEYHLENYYCFFWIRKWLDDYRHSVYERNAEKFAYVFNILYTIRLSQLRRGERYGELSNALGGYVWGTEFDIMFSNAKIDSYFLNRSRFYLPTYQIYNTIAARVGQEFGVDNEVLNMHGMYVSKIQEKDQQKEYKILTWLLLGLLSNMYRTENRPSGSFDVLVYSSETVIFSNYVLMKNQQICMENYIIGLCNPAMMYTKINMDMLGITWNEYNDIFTKILNENKEKIAAFQTIFTNMDLIYEFYDYCYRYRETKEGGEKDEHGKTRAVVDRFFHNAEHFLREYLNITLEGKLNELIMENMEGEKRIINISELYADIFDKFADSIKEEKKNQHESEDKREQILQDLSKQLHSAVSYETAEMPVSAYLIKKSAQNVKKNLDNLVYNIRRYFGKPRENQEMPVFDTQRLIQYYGEILDVYLRDPGEAVSKELSEEYKEIVRRYTELMKE